MLVGTANGKLTGSLDNHSEQKERERERERERLKKIETKSRGPPM